MKMKRYGYSSSGGTCGSHMVQGVEEDSAALEQQDTEADDAVEEEEEEGVEEEFEGDQLDELSEVEQEVETEKLALEDEEKQASD